VRGFVAGVVVGAALGVAGSWASNGHDAGAPAPASSAATPPVGAAGESTGAATRRTRRADAPTEAASVDAATPSAAPATPAVAIDLGTASLDELVAALRGPISNDGHLAGGIAPSAVCEKIKTRFPDFRYPVDLVVHLVDMTEHEPGSWRVFKDAMATWTNETALSEFTKRCRSRDRADARLFGDFADVLRLRGVRIPTDLCSSLLRDEDVVVRLRALRTTEFAVEVDTARIREMAARDANADVRGAALGTLRDLVVDSRRLKSEDVAETVLAALHDGDSNVQQTAEDALVAAGPKGADAAIEILTQDGDVERAFGPVEAAVAVGRAGDVLDLHLGPQVAQYAASALANRAKDHPELLRDAASRLSELHAGLAGGGSDVASSFFAAELSVFGAKTVVETALSRGLDVNTRLAAVQSLLADASTWQEGHALVRRIAADRTESGKIRVDAIADLDTNPDGASDEQVAGVAAEMKKFLAELLRDETNDRVRALIAQRLKE